MVIFFYRFKFHNLPFIKLNKYYEPNFILSSKYSKKNFYYQVYKQKLLILVYINLK